MHSSLLAVLLPSSLLRDVPETVPTYTSLKMIVKLFNTETSVLPSISVIKNSLIHAQSAGPFGVGDEQQKDHINQMILASEWILKITIINGLEKVLQKEKSSLPDSYNQ